MFDGGGLALAAVVAALFPSASAVTRSDPPPCGGLLQPQCPPPQQPPPQQSDPTPPGMATVTMHTSATDVGLAKPRVVLTGQITGAAGPRPRLVLRSESVAYSQAFPDVDGRSDASGHFRFAVRPQVNTTYRVATADGEQAAGQSPPVDVRVYPVISISFYNRMPRSFRALLTVSGPEVLNVETGAVRARAGSARYGYFYLVPRHSKFAYKLGRGRLRDAGCSVYCERDAWKAVRLTPRVRRARAILGCIRGTGFLGMGLPTPACGRRVVRLR